MKYGDTFNPYGLYHGVFIPEAIARSRELSHAAKIAYGRLLRYSGRDGKCFPSIGSLADEIGVEPRQARRYVSELEELKLIQRVARHREDGGNTSNAIEFLWHPLLDGINVPPPGQLREEGVPSLAAQGMADLAGHEESHIEENQLRHTQRVRVIPQRASDLDGVTSPRFDDSWAKYPRKQHKDLAARAWVSYVTVENEDQVFACLDRYLRSDEVARGIIMNPDKWLYEQHLNNWEGDWPARKKTLDEIIEEKYPDVEQ